ncbi:MAG: 16S rRNA (cytidine(1402)-2'-O)-methyltransferase [Legionellales bacterium]|nr:16S rRNA (cytidine(1402)-2'-O)-methyltransferase [Legionellales bacterium]
MYTPASLYIVATPIGNLNDISLRALQVLKEVSAIYAEDTRHSRILLQHFGIQKPLHSLHQHNEQLRVDAIVKQLQDGQSIAYISDAGTPGISDPGAGLVARVREQGYQVIPIPGACAVVSALSASGLAADQFFFGGFLPPKTQARQQRLQEYAALNVTTVYYESPHRIVDSLQDCVKILGAERKMIIARELTKNFETFLSGSTTSLLDQVIADNNQQKGEFVLLISALEKQPSTIDKATQKILFTLREELPLKQACQLTEKITGIKKKVLYEFALKFPK